MIPLLAQTQEKARRAEVPRRAMGLNFDANSAAEEQPQEEDYRYGHAMSQSRISRPITPPPKYMM